MRADRKDIFKSRFQEHYSRLCHIAYGYVSDQDDAEDIVQELFISVWNKRLDDMPEKEFAAYMTTSVRNSCVSFLRKRKEDTVSEKTVENQMTKAIKLLRAYVVAHGALLVTVAAIILSIIINCE